MSFALNGVLLKAIHIFLLATLLSCFGCSSPDATEDEQAGTEETADALRGEQLGFVLERSGPAGLSTLVRLEFEGSSSKFVAVTNVKDFKKGTPLFRGDSVIVRAALDSSGNTLKKGKVVVSCKSSITPWTVPPGTWAVLRGCG